MIFATESALGVRDEGSVSVRHAIVSIGAKLCIAAVQGLRNWVRQVDVDAGATPPGPTTQKIAEIKALKGEVAELRQPNDILNAASFLRGPNSTGRSHAPELHR